jgi:hypothetical protein
MRSTYEDTKYLVEGFQQSTRGRRLLIEGMKTAQELPAHLSIQIQPTRFGLGGFRVYLISEDADIKDGPLGEVSASRPMPSDYGKALDAYEVTSSGAPDGWGPLLYDIAMEVAAENGSGIMSDRKSVSYSARGIWEYYRDSRDDVEYVQLDNMQNQLTPQDSDNALQHSARRASIDWVDSELSKMYRTRLGATPTLDFLRQAGKLDDWR